MILLISWMALATFSSVSAVTRQCRSSSRFGPDVESLDFPSLTDPRPRMLIFAPDSVSIFFKVLPRGPIKSPIKLISGNSLTGM